jgi:hypothetical protein
MASPVKIYQKEMYQNLGFFATWFPGDKVELGEAGVLKNGRYRRESSLSEIGIDFKVDSPGTPQTLQFTSASGMTINTSLNASATHLADAEISVEFSNEGAFLFHASGVKQMRIEDRSAVGRAILDAYERGDWEKDWYIVEALYQAECATIILSQDRSSAMVITASSNVPLGSLPLANPKANLSIKSIRGTVFHLVARKKLTPLYVCLRVRDSLFRKPNFRTPDLGQITY